MKLKNKQTLFLKILFLVVAITYLVIMGTRTVYVTTEELVDSTLQVTQAMSLVSGHWLGHYSPYLLAKGLSFPFFLAFNHLVGLPFNLSLALFNLGAVLTLVFVVIPFVKHKHLMAIGLLICLLFNPILFGANAAIHYRDSTAYAAMIFLLAWVIGTVLNIAVSFKKSSFIISVISGVVGFPYWSNLREDSTWIYPFVFVAILVGVLVPFFTKRNARKWIVKLTVISMVPLVFLGFENLFIASMNKHYYGRFVVNEYTSKDFKAAIGTMSAIKTDSWIINVPVNQTARKEMYKYVPAFRKLKPYLDEGKKNGMDFFKDSGVPGPALGKDYQGGWFTWAYRGAVFKAGYGNNSAQVKRYNERLVSQILKAEKEGKINGSGKARVSLVAPFNMKIVKPTLSASKLVFHKMINYEGLVLELPASKNVSKKSFSKIVKFLGVEGRYSKKVNNSVAPMQVLLGLTGIAKLFSKLMILLVCGSYLYYVYWRLKHRHKGMILSDWWMLASVGMILSVILRILMLGYVTATSFNAFSPAYMSSMYSLFTVGIFCCLFADMTVAESLKLRSAS